MRVVPGRRPLLVCLLIAGSLATLAGLVFAQSDADTQHASQIRQTYNFRFGPDKPSAPGNAMTVSHDFISPGAFPTAEYCAGCHPQAYAEWRQALHSNSFRTPFYRTSVNILMRTKGIEFTRHCDSCHNPVGVLSGALTQNSQVDRKFDSDGLTCMTCHSIGPAAAHHGEWRFRHGCTGCHGGREREAAFPAWFPTQRSWRIPTGMPRR